MKWPSRPLKTISPTSARTRCSRNRTRSTSATSGKSCSSQRLPFYKKFVIEHSHDPRLQEQLAKAYFRLGDITRVIASSQDAREYYRLALETWEPLAHSDPANLELQQHVADCHFVFGQILQAENLPEAIAFFSSALASYQKLTEQKPSEARYQSSLAACCSELGLCFSRLDRIDEALQFLNRARGIQEHLVALNPRKIEYKKNLAEIINHVGYLDFTRRDYPAALQVYRQFQKLCREILDELPAGPKPLNILDLLARSHYNIASIERDQGHAELSLEASREAEENWARLAESHPSVNSYQSDLGLALWLRAWAEFTLGKSMMPSPPSRKTSISVIGCSRRSRVILST